MESIKIQTAQNVELEYEMAGIGSRILAVLIDTVIVIAYILALVIITGMGEFYGFGGILVTFLFFLPSLLYPLLCEIFMDGQTFGKRFLHIKVVKIDGSQPTLGSYVLRWLLRFADSFMFLGLVVMLFTEREQRLGDLAAGTVVIKLKQRVTLDDTILVKLDDGYVPTYPQVEKLSDTDMEVIRDVLSIAGSDDAPVAIIDAISQAKRVVEKKMGVVSSFPPVQFLNTVLQDYNYYKGVV